MTSTVYFTFIPIPTHRFRGFIPTYYTTFTIMTIVRLKILRRKIGLNNKKIRSHFLLFLHINDILIESDLTWSNDWMLHRFISSSPL